MASQTLCAGDAGAESRKCGICSSLVLNRGVLDCCTHWFCFTCIDDWATVTNLCPLCKAHFQFITCLPVSGYDNGSRDGTANIGYGLERREEQSNHDESTLPFSFPSYFIDEEAVVCLEGDACRVRAGLLSSEDKGSVAADTSVACDLCDCWYHAGCVNFDPEQSSFYCPRCIASHGKSGNSLDPLISGTPTSSKAPSSSLVESVLPAKELTYGTRTLLDSASVAIAVAEKGESAVSISMRRIPDAGQPSAQPTSASSSEDMGLMWSPIRETVNVPQTYGAIWSPIRELVKPDQTYELWSPTGKSVDRFENTDELLSPTPKRGNALSSSPCKDPPILAPTLSVKRLDPPFSLAQKPTGSQGLGTDTRAVNTSTHQNCKCSLAIKSLDICASRELSAEVAPTMKLVKRSEDFTRSPDIMKEENMLIDVDRLQAAVEQLKRGKRRVLQEDERMIKYTELPEPPRKVPRKSIRRNETSESRTLVVPKDSSREVLGVENCGKKNEACQNKVYSSDPPVKVAVRSATKAVASEGRTLAVPKDSQQEVVGDVNGMQELEEYARKPDASEGRMLALAEDFPSKVLEIEVSSEQIDEGQNKDLSSEPTCKVAQYAMGKGNASEDKALLISKDSRNKVFGSDNGFMEIDDGQSKVISSTPPSKVARKSTQNPNGSESRSLDVSDGSSNQELRNGNGPLEIDEGQRKVVISAPSRKVTEKSLRTNHTSEDTTSAVLKDNCNQVLEIGNGRKEIEGLQSKGLRSEPPHKVARKSTPKDDASESRALTVPKDSSKEVLGIEHAKEKIDDCKRKVLSNTMSSKDMSKGISVEENGSKQVDGHEKLFLRDNKQKSPILETNSEVDVMDIVSDPRHPMVKGHSERSSVQKGVRTRIIMHREIDAKSKEGPSLAERIRQQMKDAAGYGAGEELGKVEVSDDRFLAAFKAALARSHEKSKEARSTASASRQRRSDWLAKVLSQGKGSRDSLTRKLYAGGTGRWDRDWDIAFWKERAANIRRARKEAKDEIEGKAGIRIGDKKSDAEESDSIFSRLYIADTSLFPRKDDVKPLSAQASLGGCPSEEKRAIAKSLQGHPENCNLEQSFSNKPGKVPVVESLLGTKQTLEKLSVAFDAGRPRTVPSESRMSEKSIGSCALPRESIGHAKGPNSIGNSKANVGLGTVDSPSSKLSAKATASLRPQVSTVPKMPCNGSDLTTSNKDVKKDKRQWALEVLARKTGATANPSVSANVTEGSSSKGQFDLLLQLPIDMRPLLPHNRRSKVPTAVRQVQLNRLVEQELVRAKLVVIQKSPECEEAVNRAQAREEELYKKANSKGVYLNLCARALAQTTTTEKRKEDSESDVSDLVKKALEATGLLASPPASPNHNQDIQNAVLMEIDAKEATVDHSRKPRTSCEKEWVEDVLEMENLDFYGDFEFNLDDNLEDTTFLEKPHSLKLGPSMSTQDSENKPAKVMVVLTTASGQANSAQKPGEFLSNTLLDLQPLKEEAQIAEANGSPSLPTSAQDVSLVGVGSHVEDEDDLYGGLEVRLNAVPTSNASDAIALDKEGQSVVSLEAQPDRMPGSQTLKSVGSESEFLKNKDIESLTIGEGSQPPAQGGSDSLDDWMNSDKFADLDRRIENIQQNTSPSANGESDLPWKSKVRSSGEPLGPSAQNPVQKQVEIFVNQHLKPLYRSGVIKADQFRYAVSKTAIKVMEHHVNAMSADFLITEGSKVRKLADQYLQAFSKRKPH